MTTPQKEGCKRRGETQDLVRYSMHSEKPLERKGKKKSARWL